MAKIPHVPQSLKTIREEWNRSVLVFDRKAQTSRLIKPPKRLWRKYKDYDYVIFNTGEDDPR